MIERLHPGVFVTEVPFNAKPIEGVSVPTHHCDAAHATDHRVHLPSEGAPAWTQANPGDPGVALVELLEFLADAMAYRANPILQQHARPHGGVAQGLAVDAPDACAAPKVNVSPGLALGADGRSVAADSATAQLRVPKP